MTPTNQVSTALQLAFDQFNHELFKDSLPPCMVVLHRHNGSFGYFARQRFENDATRQRVDEIALCPDTFRVLGRDTRRVMSTLVHEMCHMWQHHFGQPGRMRYHNAEWGRLMESVGLIPSHTGEPGGKKTGDQMTHYIEEGGLFDRTFAALEADGFRFDWHDPSLVQMLAALGVDPTAPAAGAKVSRPKAKSDVTGNRKKFTCPGCGLNAWAKPTARLTCGECEEEME